MNKKIIHIVSSDAAKERVLRLIKSSDNAEIEVCPTLLSYGILPEDYTKRELAATAASFKNIGWTDDLYKFVHRDYSVYDKVIVWHGRDAGELLLLYLMADLTRDNLYEIDVADCEELLQKFICSYRYHFPVIFVAALNIEDMECQNLVGKYLKKVGEEQQNQYQSNWEYWRNTTSLIRVCRNNNWEIDLVGEEIIVEKMHEIMNSDWFCQIPNREKYSVLLSKLAYDLYVDYSFLDICYRIVDFVLETNTELTDNGIFIP